MYQNVSQRVQETNSTAFVPKVVRSMIMCSDSSHTCKLWWLCRGVHNRCLTTHHILTYPCILEPWCDLLKSASSMLLCLQILLEAVGVSQVQKHRMYVRFGWFVASFMSSLTWQLSLVTCPEGVFASCITRIHDFFLVCTMPLHLSLVILFGQALVRPWAPLAVKQLSYMYRIDIMPKRIRASQRLLTSGLVKLHSTLVQSVGVQLLQLYGCRPTSLVVKVHYHTQCAACPCVWCPK